MEGNQPCRNPGFDLMNHSIFTSPMKRIIIWFCCASSTQVGVVGPSPTRRSCWGSAGDWSRMRSIAHCNNTNRKHFKMGAGQTPRPCSPLETLRIAQQRRTLQLTPLKTTGSDIIGLRHRDWKNSRPDNISQAWLTRRRVSKPWAQSLNQPTSQPSLLTS